MTSPREQELAVTTTTPIETPTWKLLSFHSRYLTARVAFSTEKAGPLGSICFEAQVRNVLLRTSGYDCSGDRAPHCRCTRPWRPCPVSRGAPAPARRDLGGAHDTSRDSVRLVSVLVGREGREVDREADQTTVATNQYSAHRISTPTKLRYAGLGRLLREIYRVGVTIKTAFVEIPHLCRQVDVSDRPPHARQSTTPTPKPMPSAARRKIRRYRDWIVPMMQGELRRKRPHFCCMKPRASQG